jgi:hypothetical protein
MGQDDVIGRETQPMTGSTGDLAPGDDERVETRIGALSFERGFPSAETARKLYDELDFQRAVQAFLWAFPAVSFHPGGGQAGPRHRHRRPGHRRRLRRSPVGLADGQRHHDLWVAEASTRSSASMARQNRCSTEHGRCRTRS